MFPASGSRPPVSELGWELPGEARCAEPGPLARPQGRPAPPATGKSASAGPWLGPMERDGNAPPHLHPPLRSAGQPPGSLGLAKLRADARHLCLIFSCLVVI